MKRERRSGLSLVAVVFLAGAVLAGTQHQEDDPLLAKHQGDVRRLKRGFLEGMAPPDSAAEEQKRAAVERARLAYEWVLTGSARTAAADLALRDFFSGSVEARREVSTTNAAKGLPAGVRYVVEEVNYQGLFAKVDSGEGTALPERPAWSKSLTAVVTVFCSEEIDSRGLDFISLAWISGRPGRKRGLRSRGPYQQYRVTVANLDESAKVVSCMKGVTFVSARYVADTTRRRLMMHLHLLLDGSSKDVGARLPAGADNPVPGDSWTAYVEAEPRENGGLPGGPWRVSVLSSEQGAVSSAERFLLVFSYDMPKDTITVTSCTRDPEFAKKRDELNVVAAFAKKYLLSATRYRRQVWSGSGKSGLPEEGSITIFGTLSFKNVVPVSEKMWKVECRIMHSGGFGRNVRHAAAFSCEIQKGDDGGLTVVSDDRRF